jgi:hypothetical protein
MIKHSKEDLEESVIHTFIFYRYTLFVERYKYDGLIVMTLFRHVILVWSRALNNF